MNTLINEIFGFFKSLFDSVQAYFTSINSNIYTDLLPKQIIDGSLISVNLTFQELTSVILPLVCTFLLVYGFIRLCIALIKLFRV